MAWRYRVPTRRWPGWPLWGWILIGLAAGGLGAAWIWMAGL